MQPEMALDLDLNTFAEQILLVLLLLGGIALLLGHIVLGQTQLSSNPDQRKRSTNLQDSLGAVATTEKASTRQITDRSSLLARLHATKGKEKRASLRRKGNAVGAIVLTGDPPKVEPALVIDRSKGGLCLSLGIPMPVGTKLQIRACHAPKELPSVHVVVRHCAQKGDRWHMGCQFVDNLPWSVLLLFG